MKKFRVFLETVRDPEDPVLIARLMRLSRRDERQVKLLLRELPLQLAEGVDHEGVRYLRSFLDGVGARVLVKDLRPGSKVKSRGRAPGSRPAALNLMQRFSWGFEVFARTWQRQTLLLLMAVAVALLSGVVIAWFARSQGGVEMFTDNPLAVMGILQSPLFFVVVLMLQIATVLAGFWHQAALVRLTASYMEGAGDTPVAEILFGAWQRLPDLVTAVMVWTLPLFLGFGAVTLAGQAWLLPEQPTLAALLTLAVLAFFCLVLAACVLTGPVAVLETTTPRETLQRAWALSRGRRWRIFGNLLLLGVALVAVNRGVELLLMAVGLTASTVGIYIGWFFSFGLGLVFLFLFNFLVTAFYFEGRVLSERWDPPWDLVPHPSWLASDEPAIPAGGRGPRAWLELLFASLVALALLLAGLAFLAANMEQLIAPVQDPVVEQVRVPAAPTPPPKPTQPLPQEAAAGDLLAAPKSAPDSPPTLAVSGQATAAGAELHLAMKNFFAQPGGSMLWLKVSLQGVAGVPEEVSPGELLGIDIFGVYGPGAGNLHAKQDLPKDGVDRRVALKRRADGFDGGYAVRLRSGVKREQVDLIAGEALLRLPFELRSVTLDAGTVGSEREVFSDLSLSLTSMGVDRAELVMLGNRARQRVIGVEGVSASGEQFPPAGVNSIVFDNRLELKAQFSRPVERVRLLLVKGWKESRHPFELQVGQGLSLPLK